MDMPNLPPRTRKKCLKLLYNTCGHFALLPRSLKIDVYYDKNSPPHCSGGFSYVWKGSYRGRAVAVKVLKIYSNRNMQKQIGVRCGCALCPGFACGCPNALDLDVLQRSNNMEDPSTSKCSAISWGDDVRESACDDIRLDGKRKYQRLCKDASGREQVRACRFFV